MELLQQIFELCIVPLLGVITLYVKKLIEKKNEEIDNKLSDETTKKYVDLLSSTISECVVSTNQTYVDSLKNKNAFTKEAQEEAFNLTYEKVMDLLTDTAKNSLSEVYGDLEKYITTKIEAEVNAYKCNSTSDEKTVVAAATAAVTAVTQTQE